MTDPSAEPSGGRHLRLVRGDATPEEIAALVAVLMARSAPAAAPPPVRSAWADRTAALRRGVPTGAGAWRRSGFAAGVRTRADW